MLAAGKESAERQVILRISPGLYRVCRPITWGREDGETAQLIQGYNLTDN